MKQKPILNFFFIIFVFLHNIKFSAQDENPYRVYNTNNNYPRPLLLKSGDVMAFSGNPARMSRYTKDGDLVYADKTMGEGYENFAYDKNAAFIQFTNSNDNKERFVMAEGQGKLKLYLIDDNGIIKKKEFTEDSVNIVSFKIDIYKLADNSIIASYVHGYYNNGNCIGQQVHLRTIKYDEDKNDFVFGDLHIVENTDNCYVSCTQTINSLITCMYVKDQCKEYSLTFHLTDPNSKIIKDIDMSANSGCGFDKVIHLDNNYVVYTYLNDNKIKYKICEVKEDKTLSFITENTAKSSLTQCIINTMKVDVTKIGANSFAISCVGTEAENRGHVEIVNFDGTNFNSETKTTITKNIDYPFVSKFGDKFLSLFYNIKVNENGNDVYKNVFEIIGYPACEDFQARDIYINDKTDPFSLTNYVKTGSGEDTSIQLEIFFESVPSQSSDGSLSWNSGTTSGEVSEGEHYSKDIDFIFQSGYQNGTIKINYAAKRGEKIGPLCWMIFNVKNCYLGCKSCPQLGNQIDNQCYGCNDTGDYTSEYEEKDLGRTKTINCHKLGEIFERHYEENGYFKSCWDTCKFCIDEGESQYHHCTECLTTDEDDNIIATYPVVDDDFYNNHNFNCYKEEDSPNGYFFNGTHHLKCYISCKTCSAAGTEEKNNCDSCNFTYGYYKFEDADEIEDLNGQCSQTDYPGYHYLYDPDPSSTTDEKIWKVCYDTCSKCSEGGIDNENNCEKCKENYYKIEGDTKGTCTDEQPTHYYLDKSTIIYLDDEGDEKEEEYQMYKTCYESCNDCTNFKNETSMNCKKNDNCYDNTYHKLSDVDTECHNDTTVPDNYYYNSSTDKYERCHIGCKKCSTYSNDNENTLCTEKKCSERYAYVIDKKTQCYINETNLLKYYLTTDEDGKQCYKKCAEGCLTCVSETRNDCTSCINDEKYYQNYTDKDKDKFMCYYHPDDDTSSGGDSKQDEAPSHYVYSEGTSTETKKYVQLCYNSCKTCVEGGGIGDHNCKSCIENHYFIIDTENCVQDPEE